MDLQQMLMSRFNPKKVKYLTINVIGLAGIAIAITSIMISQDQMAELSHLGHLLLESPVGDMISSIKYLF